MKYFYLVIIFQMCISSLIAQTRVERDPSIQVIARSFGDSIVLRWAPDSPLAWKKSLKEGFMIERYTLKGEKADKKNKPGKELLTPEPVKAWELPRWEELVKNNDFAAVAAQAIYGKSFEVQDQSSDVMQMVNQARELENRFSFALFAADQSLSVAQASGLTYTDKSVKKGEKYFYKIYALVPRTDYPIDTGMAFIGTDDFFELPKPLNFKAEFSDRVVMLSWNRAYYEHIYSGYFVERSDDGGKSFQKTHKQPIVNTSPSAERKADNYYRIDSLPQNNRNYVFRIRGTTPFEETGQPSDTVQGMGRPSPAYMAPNITGTENLADGGIKITWRSPAEYNEKISKFIILRSDKANGDYGSLDAVPGHERSYIDPKPKRVNYYIISALDSNLNALSSFPALGQLIDSIAPITPSGLKASVEKNGKLTLSWNRGKEDDLAGYRIYMANEEGVEFTQVTTAPVKDTLWTDTIKLNTLTPKIYFKVMAMDISYNLSPMSEALEVKRPDIIPPVAPRVSHYEASDSGFFLQWIPSSSADVLKHRIYRKEKHSTSWKIIADINIKDSINEFFDNKLKPKAEYLYVVAAVDDSGLESEKDQQISASLPDYGIRKGPEEIEAKADRMKKEIELKWEYTGPAPERVLVYRASGDEPLRLYKSIEGNSKKFVDKRLNMNTGYTYKIQFAYPDGGASPLSKAKTVNF